jgi:hypothetical protein
MSVICPTCQTFFSDGKQNTENAAKQVRQIKTVFRDSIVQLKTQLPIFPAGAL